MKRQDINRPKHLFNKTIIFWSRFEGLGKRASNHVSKFHFTTREVRCENQILCLSYDGSRIKKKFIGSKFSLGSSA